MMLDTKHIKLIARLYAVQPLASEQLPHTKEEAAMLAAFTEATGERPSLMEFYRTYRYWCKQGYLPKKTERSGKLTPRQARAQARGPGLGLLGKRT